MQSKIDHEEVKKILLLFEEKNLSEFELEVEGFRIKISKNSPNSLSREKVIQTEINSSPQPVLNSPFEDAAPLEKDNNLVYITSPIIGTFYRAPSPNSPPFVEIGDQVKKSQTLCIVEAMKLMNEIESNSDGIIKEIFVENGKPVEYGQRLFSIHPLL